MHCFKGSFLSHSHRSKVISFALIVVLFAIPYFFEIGFITIYQPCLNVTVENNYVDKEKTKDRDKENFLCDVAIAINTAPKFRETRVVHQLESWVNRVCPKNKRENLFFIGIDEPNLPGIDPGCGDSFDNNCCKSMAGFKFIYEKTKGKNINWYLKVDDDTFVMPGNLHRALAQYNPNERLLLGRALSIQINPDDFSFVDQARFSGITTHKYNLSERIDQLYYVSGGSGYLLSKGLMESLSQNMTYWDETVMKLCTKLYHEDVVMGQICRLQECQVTRVLGMELPIYIPNDIRSNSLKTFHAIEHSTDYFWFYDLMFHNNDIVHRNV